MAVIPERRPDDLRTGPTSTYRERIDLPDGWEHGEPRSYKVANCRCRTCTDGAYAYNQEHTSDAARAQARRRQRIKARAYRALAARFPVEFEMLMEQETRRDRSL